jgi:hypothetical protein
MHERVTPHRRDHVQDVVTNVRGHFDVLCIQLVVVGESHDVLWSGTHKGAHRELHRRRHGHTQGEGVAQRRKNCVSACRKQRTKYTAVSTPMNTHADAQSYFDCSLQTPTNTTDGLSNDVALASVPISCDTASSEVCEGRGHRRWSSAAHLLDGGLQRL